MTGFDKLLSDTSVVLVVGSGGVGKTTTAAAMGLRAAELGSRAVVVTVDPARRLADALGIDSGLTAHPQLVHQAASGQMWASMLDPRTTFDRLLDEESEHDDLTARIQANRMYGNLADGLSGTQEYLATEELFRLYQDDRFDLVIVDTPPSRHALDIVDAPGRLVTLFDNRLYQLLTGHSSGAARIIGRTAHRFVRTVAGVVGADVLEDAIEFFTLFESLEGGFRERAVAVQALLTGPASAVVLVASPSPDVVITGLELAEALRNRSLTPDALVVNLLHPDPSDGDTSLQRPADSALGRLARRAANERRAIAPLQQSLGHVPTVMVPTLAEDIHDRDGLSHVVRCLSDG